MKIRIGNGLLPLNLLVLGLVAVIFFFPSNFLRIILGLPFVLFFPGYVLLLALFPKKEGMGGIERVALSFGISIAIVSLVGLMLNYTPWGIRLEPVLWSAASFIFITSIVAWLRHRRVPEQERFGIEFQLKAPGWGGGMWDKTLSIVVVIAILGALGTLGYVIATTEVGEKFTQFYILEQEGEAADYPQELRIGEVGKVVVGIGNHEHQEISYNVEIRLAGTLIEELGPVVLQHEQKWEQEVSVIPVRVGENQKLEFLLFKEGGGEPYKRLHLWLDVKEGG